MITDAIKSIVEAEDASAAEIKKAEAKRSEIISNAEIQADSVRKTGSENVRKFLSEQNSQSLQQANDASSKEEAAICGNIDAEIEQNQQNAQKAIDFVVEKLI